MGVVAADGFVIAGGVALQASGLSDRRTEDLDAFSATCDDVAKVSDRLVSHLRANGYEVDVGQNGQSYSQMIVSTGKYRRTVLRVELGRDAQLLDTVDGPLGPMLSTRELAANKILAAFGRHEPRDLADLAALDKAADLDQAIVDASAKDPGFDPVVFAEMVAITAQRPDRFWPAEVDPVAIRNFVNNTLLSR